MKTDHERKAWFLKKTRKGNYPHTVRITYKIDPKEVPTSQYGLFIQIPLDNGITYWGFREKSGADKFTLHAIAGVFG